jgi:hypothetical protein
LLLFPFPVKEVWKSLVVGVGVELAPLSFSNCSGVI